MSLSASCSLTYHISSCSSGAKHVQGSLPSPLQLCRCPQRASLGSLAHSYSRSASSPLGAVLRQDSAFAVQTLALPKALRLCRG